MAGQDEGVYGCSIGWLNRLVPHRVFGMERVHSALPLEVIEKILLCITDLDDLLECAAVCRAWNNLFQGQYYSGQVH